MLAGALLGTATVAGCGVIWTWLKISGAPNWGGWDAAFLRLFVSRVALLATAASLGLAGLWQAAKVREALWDFFLRPAHPLNLAIFRIVVFGAIFLRASSPAISEFAGCRRSCSSRH